MAKRDRLLPLAALAGFCAISLYAWSGGGSGHDSEFRQCFRITQDSARLACYDNLVAQMRPAKGGMPPFLTHSGAQP